MSLGVGIHKNVQVTKVTKNDKGTLVIGFKQDVEVDPLAALSTAGQTDFDQPELDLLVYSPRVQNFNGGLKNTEELLNSIAELKDPLDHIASVYLTADKRKWDVFANTGITKDNLSSLLAEQTTMDKVYANIITQFISMMTGVIGTSSKKVNVMFIRQSKAKHYPKLRTKYLTTYPFIEPADVNPSKLRFSKYESEQGYDKGDAAGGAQTVNTAEAAQASSMFATK